MTRKMSATEILDHLLKGQGMSLDREAVMEVINSMGEVGFSATRIARIIKGEAAELAAFRRHLEKLAETNSELRKVAELQIARVVAFEGQKTRTMPAERAGGQGKERAPARKTAAAKPADPGRERSPAPGVSVFEIMGQDPMEAILRGPRPH